MINCSLTLTIYYSPSMTMAGALSVNPVCLYICPYVTPNEVRSLKQIVLIITLWNLVTLLSTLISSSSLILVHITPCLQELWPFVYENSPFETMLQIVLIRILWNLVTLFSTMSSSSSIIGRYGTMLLRIMALCLWKFTVWNDVQLLVEYFWSQFYETWSHCLVS